MTPTCDLCGEAQRDGSEGEDWNGDTGNHRSCEAEGADARAETKEGVGWVVQVRERKTGIWLNWTQWHQLDKAETHVRSLLASKRYDFDVGRIQRVDWTVVSEVVKEEVADGS